jgi:hypothetical protein
MPPAGPPMTPSSRRVPAPSSFQSAGQSERRQAGRGPSSGTAWHEAKTLHLAGGLGDAAAAATALTTLGDDDLIRPSLPSNGGLVGAIDKGAPYVTANLLLAEWK